MKPQFARSIGDDYADYVDDEFGYTYHAWEVISASESARHERIRRATMAGLKDLAESMSPLSDLDRWVLARRHLLDEGDEQTYFELLQPLLDGDFDHPALHYPEILLDVARRHAEQEQLDRARQLVDDLARRWPQFDDIIPLLQANLLLYGRRFDEAHRAYEEALSDEEDVIDLYIEAAEDFLRFGALELAHEWLNSAEETAHDEQDHTSLVDIKLLSGHLHQARQAAEDAAGEDPDAGES